MTVYPARIPATPGDVVVFDGARRAVLSRADGARGNDTFRVEHDGEVTERHIDWFADQAATADRIVIEKA